MRVILFIGILLAGFCPRAGAAEADPVALDTVVDAALRNNLGLAIVRHGPAMAREDVQAARAVFDPTLELSAARRESRQSSSASELEGSDQPTSARDTWGLSLSRKAVGGGTLGLEGGFDRQDTDSSFATLNPSYDVDLAVSFRQPLLQGRGRDVNLAAVQKGEIAVARATLEVRAEVLDLLLEAETRYWRAVTAARATEVRRLSLEAASATREEALARRAAGVAIDVEVLEAAAAVESRREAVIRAEKEARDAADRLLMVMGRMSETRAAAMPSARDLPPPPDLDPEPAAAAAAARLAQPEYLAQQEIIRARDIDVRTARDQVRPTLDLTGRGGYTGRDGDAGGAFDQAINGDGYSWSVDLAYRHPLGRRAGAAGLRRARMSALQENLRLDQLDQQLALDIREACRAVTAGRERVRAARSSRELSEQFVEQQRARYGAGLVTVRTVLDAQADLDQARLSELLALQEAVEADIRLQRLQGALLNRHALTWVELEKENPPVE